MLRYCIKTLTRTVRARGHRLPILAVIAERRPVMCPHPEAGAETAIREREEKFAHRFACAQ